MGRENPVVNKRRLEIRRIQAILAQEDQNKRNVGNRFSEKAMSIRELIELRKKLTKLQLEEKTSIGKK